MDPIGKLPGGIIGTTICLILLLAAALPIMNAMISTVDKETTGPGQVTESGTNDYGEPYFSYMPAPKGTHSYVWSMTRSQDVISSIYYEDNVIKGQQSGIDDFTVIVSGQEPGRLHFTDGLLYIDTVSQSLVYSDLTGFDMTYWFDNSVANAMVLRVGTSQYIEGSLVFSHFTFTGPEFIFAQTLTGMTPTHGWVSGDPDSVMGDSVPTDRAFKVDASTNLAERIVIEMRGTADDQRRFMLDNGYVLDLDDKETPIKSASKSDNIPGAALKTSRALVSTAIMVWKGGIRDVLAGQDVSSEYTATWGEFQAPRDLEVPMLESVSLAGSPVAGWFIPMEWEHTGTGIVTVKTMIYSVLSVVPLILVVALFILVARWMRPESGAPETDALLGGSRPKYDGWRDRR